MGGYDQAARFATRADPGAVLQRLLVDEGVAWEFREWLDTRNLPLPRGPDRTAGMVAATSDLRAVGRPWLVVTDFQTQADPDELDATLEEVAILRSRLRFGEDRRGKYRVVAGFVDLLAQGLDDILDMTLPSGAGTRHAPLVWHVAKDDAARTLESVALGQSSWGMLFWIPLMAGGEDERVIDRWREVVTARVENRPMRGNLGGIALMFAELVGRLPEWRRRLEGFEMTESQVVNEWILEGMLEERVVLSRKHLHRLLDRRFLGIVPVEIRRLIDHSEDTTLLGEWIDLAIDSTFEEFMQVVRR